MSKDTIYRQDAIDAIRSMQTYKLFAGDDLILVDQAGAETELMMLPSAEPERKRGKWINHRKDRGHNIADCDQCGGTLQWLDPDERPNFCPECGADMREEEEQ